MSENDLPDKCGICGLKQTYPGDSDDLFKTIHLLSEKGIVPEIPRKLYKCVEGDKETGRDEFCLISHPKWSKKNKKCKSWQLDIGLPKGDVLAINLAFEIRYMTKMILYLTCAIIILTILQIGIVVITPIL